MAKQFPHILMDDFQLNRSRVLSYPIAVSAQRSNKKRKEEARVDILKNCYEKWLCDGGGVCVGGVRDHF